MIKGQDMHGKIRVLVVDDSAFFRHHLSNILSAHEKIEVVGTARDGKAGVEAARALKPDVITMDVEMPIMDGISAVKRVMSEVPTPILMLSSYTYAGAQATLNALQAGAVDFISKQNNGNSNNVERLSATLVQKVLAVSKHRVLKPVAVPVLKMTAQTVPSRSRESPLVARQGGYDLVVIGASTGGPVAIQNLISSLPGDFSVPLVIAVHMPGNFTKAFAERLDSICALNVKEADNGDRLQAGSVLLAPGGKQLSFSRKGADTFVCVNDGKQEETYKPSIDITLGSAAQVMRDSVLAVILTGMGADGCKGAGILKQNKSTVWSQDEASCVIYGMPQAVEKKGFSDMVLPLSEIAQALVKAV